MADPIEPFPFQELCTDRMEYGEGSGLYVEYQTARSFPAITADATEAWQQLHPLLVGLQHLANNRDLAMGFTAPARLEFMKDPVEHRCGVAIFDSLGQLIVHVLAATLGYGSPGSELSNRIMSTLGVPPQMMMATHQYFTGRPRYKALVSREPLTDLDGTIVAYPSLDVTPDWVTMLVLR